MTSLAVSVPARADLVTDWAQDAARTIPPPGVASATLAEQFPVYGVDLATFHVAIFDTVNAFTGRYQPFAAVPAAPVAGASVEAAVNEAAYRVLQALFPSRSAFYEAQYQARMSQIPAGNARDRGRAVGEDVAAQVLQWRANDGRNVLVPWSNGTMPGEFQSRTGVPLVNRNVPSMRPFTMTSASQFRPDGPPSLTSALYAEDFNEVKRSGIEDARSSREPAEDELAWFHTEPPPAFWSRNLVRFADHPDMVDNARTLAAIWVAHADATIGCFEAKYHYNFWRPRTAIPAADTDGNPDTAADLTWAPNEVTPNHPEYPAAHSCLAGAMMEVVRQIRGSKKVPFIFDSRAPGRAPVTLAYESTDDFLRDIKDARIWGGMHFRTSTDDGTVLGRQVAKWVMRNGFPKPDRSR